MTDTNRYACQIVHSCLATLDGMRSREAIKLEAKLEILLECLGGSREAVPAPEPEKTAGPARFSRRHLSTGMLDIIDELATAGWSVAAISRELVKRAQAEGEVASLTPSATWCHDYITGQLRYDARRVAEENQK